MHHPHFLIVADLTPVGEVHFFLELGQRDGFALGEVKVEAPERAQLDGRHHELRARMAVLVEKLQLVSNLKGRVLGIISRAGGGRFAARKYGRDHLLAQTAVAVPAETKTLSHRRGLYQFPCGAVRPVSWSSRGIGRRPRGDATWG